MYLLAPFILQNFKKTLKVDPELWGCAIFGPKMAHLSWTNYFWCKPLLLLSSTYWPFSLCKILKSSYNGSRIITMHHFWDQSGPFAPNKFFSWKTITITVINRLTLFIVQNLKKNLPADQELWGCANNGTKMVHFPK